ncbi:ethanolamine ammonia-lyase reactivating factor EutA [Clostridium algoriphilum]|uniref:ethanolamine ammonia-lyase reactivating factor EutA n=1 Tax=Clostridium algoriphilum TaxID=198347 RepID=UPI001CF1FDEB|nr:ethanolamine ammonia-lyase reactivating factor EutA [Clostridium algoriphilum]MCB2295481.1 ethanolamine ammonia-lyase reactivating factor EutA [Clostridium algoriphilum]
MKTEILSVGIDIGTTTLQVIFSKISVQNTASLFLLPEVKITSATIIYRSKIYFTPLISRERIDLKAIKDIISSEYKKSNILKTDISTGAIIITGETCRKENAEEVLNYLSDFAGDFVVATAGPDLEGILAGFGAGAALASKKHTSKVVNFDIGGGTTNASVFWDGQAIDSFALDIGGRLIQLDIAGTITYVSDKIKPLIKSLNLNLSLGVTADFRVLKLLTDAIAKMFIKINGELDLDVEIERLFIHHKHKEMHAEFIMFSGGVAEFIYSKEEIGTMDTVIRYGDIGPLLGYSIRKVYDNSKEKILESIEKIRATVIGAGSHSLKLSGSTIVYDDTLLPIKNIPIVKLFSEDEDLPNMQNLIHEKLELYDTTAVAIAFKGPKSPSYLQIKSMAEAIVNAFKTSINPIIVIVEQDFAKALGQSINNLLKGSKGVICLDKIKASNGDYVDIGKSISKAVPVVIKTLIFKI